MAYDKVYPQNGQSILAFDTNQEDRVASEFGVQEITSGSTPNGSWTKFPDGTLICRGKMELVFDNAQTLSKEWNFPLPFIDSNYDITLTFANYAPGGLLREASLYSLNRTSNKTYISSIINNTSSYTSSHTQSIMMIAIGRWK